MRVPLLLLVFVFVCQAQSSINCTDQTIFLNGSWSLPLSAIQERTDCTLKFDFSPSYFAFMSFKAIDMASNDLIYLEYGLDSIIATSKDSNSSTFISNLAWGKAFNVWIRSFGNGTKMNVQIDIDLFPNTMGQNNKNTFDVAENFQPQLLYLEDMVEGATYYANGHTGNVWIDTAILSYTFNDTFSLANVFIYADSRFLGTLYNVYSTHVEWHQRQIKIYVARKPEIAKGAVIFNDQSNYGSIYSGSSIYVPLNQPNLTTVVYEYADYHATDSDGAITVVGDRDGSTPFDVTDFFIEQDLTGRAYFSWAVGGVQRDHKNATKVDNSVVPMHFTGNLNTIYLSSGTGIITVTVNE